MRRRLEEGRVSLASSQVGRIEFRGYGTKPIVILWLPGQQKLVRGQPLCSLHRLVLSGFSLVYTHRMGLLGPRRRQHRKAARLLALVLLAGVFALTSTPVCGSVLDIDPIACCEHHACGQSANSCPGKRHLRQSRGECSSIAGGACDTGSGAERCCELGRLNHPNAKLQPSTSATHVLNVLAALALPSLAPPPTFSQALYAEAPLKIPLIPSYTLTATYRI